MSYKTMMQSEEPWTWPEQKAAAVTIETKSSGETQNPLGSLVGFLQQNGNWDLSFAVLIEYYQRCSPYSDAVDKITEAFKSIIPKVLDIQTGEFVDHPILKLLAYPNDSMGMSDFMEHLCGMVLITNNPLLDILGNTNREPLALDVLSPQFVDLQPGPDGNIGTIRYTDEFANVFYKADIVNRRKRFRASNDMEAWPMMGFNPRRGTRNFWATPIAKPLYNEIEQYLSAGTHNKSLLQNGARPGGTFTVKSEVPLTKEQFARLQDQIDMHYSGAGRAGRPMLMDNTEYSENIVNNRDMDYKSLALNTTSAIYRQFNIPLPLVLADTMSYNNYETAQVAMYDSAVLPVAKFIYEQLGMALFYRYSDDWQRYRLVYDETEIAALQVRRNNSIKIRKEIAVNTVNELRNKLGDDDIDGGDVILRPANDIPALDGTEDPPPKPDEKPDDNEDE